MLPMSMHPHRIMIRRSLIVCHVAGQVSFQQARKHKQQAKGNDGSQQSKGSGAKQGQREDTGKDMAERLVPHVSAQSTIQMKNRKKQKKMQRPGAGQQQAGGSMMDKRAPNQ